MCSNNRHKKEHILAGGWDGAGFRSPLRGAWDAPRGSWGHSCWAPRKEGTPGGIKKGT